MEIKTRIMLLDIEGTTSSVSYVFDVLYPFARDNMPDFLERRFEESSVQAAVKQLSKDLDKEFSADRQAAKKEVIAETTRLMDEDVKATGLKELQGIIWAEGYEAGKLKSHLYEDVFPALKNWKKAGLDIRIFSSGSIGAQKVFFKNTEFGDLSQYFTEHYDTTTGPKKIADSYKAIAEDAKVSPSEITFLSDVLEELDAAREAGMGAVLVKRPGNKPLSRENTHPEITSFGELKIALTKV